VDDRGGFHGSFAMIADITELKKTEAALLKAHAELEIRVEERTEQLASLAAELSLAEERERRRIANELHDQVGQTLAMIKIKLALLTSSSLPHEFEEHFSEIREHINWTISEIRSLTFQLSPPLLYDIGLGAALEWLGEEFEKKYGIMIEFQDDGKPKQLDEEVRGALYQMVRELLVNIVKHAQSEKVFLTYGTFSTGVAITVEDDGAGFDISGRKWYKGENPGFGLFSICNRINHLGGKCIIDSSLGQGTRVTLRIPFRESDKIAPEESLS
jgi:signal transduction histidine kinase